MQAARRPVDAHRRRADWWKQEQARTPEEQTEDHPLLPGHICEHDAERHEWRADVLDFIRDHIDPARSYSLGERDLAFGELLPEKPGWIEQEEYEERTPRGARSPDFVSSLAASRAEIATLRPIGVRSVRHRILVRRPEDAMPTVPPTRGSVAAARSSSSTRPGAASSPAASALPSASRSSRCIPPDR
jgi:hypothetical protein